MTKNSDKTQSVKTEAITQESHSLWTLPSDKWVNPLQGKNITFSTDINALKEHMEQFKKTLKSFETPVSVESLNHIVR